MHPFKQTLLETSPKWLSLTFVSSAAALMVTGVGVLFGLAEVGIGPFTLLLHLVWATTVSAWVLNLRTRMLPEKKALLGIGVAVAVGSIWSSVQQWLAFVGSGTSNDLFLVAGAMIMDATGGVLTYALYHLNILKK